MMKILGLDLGTKRIGVAVSDELKIAAHFRKLIERKGNKETVNSIIAVVEEEQIEKIVIGYPVNMNGTIGDRALDSEKIKALLEKELSIPIILWDERLSTKEAEAIMISASVSRKKRKRSIDSLAAQIILQNYLDSC